MQPLDLGDDVLSEDDSISDSSNGFSASDSNKSDSDVEIDAGDGEKGKDLAKAANDALKDIGKNGIAKVLTNKY